MRTWGWPQIVMAAILFLNLGLALAKDGTPRQGKESFPKTFVGVAINVIILYCGGFF